MSFTRLLTAGLLSSAAAISSASAADFSFSADELPDDGRVVVYVGAGGELSALGEALDARTGGRIAAAIEMTGFAGGFGETLALPAVAPFRNVVLIGSGDEALSARQLHDLGGHAAMAEDEANGLSLIVDGLADRSENAAAHIAFGYELGDYSFTSYQTVNPGPVDGEVHLIGASDSDAARFENDLVHLANGVSLARDLGTEPGNALWPQRFVEYVEEAFDDVDNIRITVLDADDIRRRGMGALMGVGQGSIHDPRLMIVEYMGGERGDAPLALVGKGVTFDTGGISLKDSNNMWYMKSDMSGAAAVAGAVLAAAERGEAINLVGLMPLAENMPSQDAIRPGDVLTSMSGRTVEILNTDAEGRLLLLDAVHYAQTEYDPAMLVNIATLTGSAARAVGDEYAVVITREMELSLEMMEIGAEAGEDVWPLPLHPNHFQQIESDIADIKNIGGSPGASIGAAVVGTFIAEDLPWVHLDIAGVDWRDQGTPTAPVGHAGWGVRFMDAVVREEAE